MADRKMKDRKMADRKMKDRKMKSGVLKVFIFLSFIFLSFIFLSFIFLSSQLSLYLFRSGRNISLIGLAFLFALMSLRFESFDRREFASGFLLSPQLLIAARQQISSLRVIRPRARGLLQNAYRLRRLPLFEQYASGQRQRLY